MALIGTLGFISAFLLFYAIALVVTGTRRRVLERVDGLDPRPVGPKRPRAKARPVKVKIDTNFMVNLEAALIKGEIDVSPRDFLMRWALVTLCLAILVFVFSGTLPAIVAIVVSIIATLAFIRSRGTRRLRRFEEGLHDMLTITANSLRSGYSFLQALQVVTEDMNGPIQDELTRVLEEMNVGVPLEQAFKSAVARIQSEDFNLIVTAILIQRQVGGNLAEVLDQISVTIRERVRLKAEVKTLTAQGRLSGLIFMILPPGLGVFIYIVSPAYMGTLFHSLIGIVMLIFAAIMQVIGFFIIRKIVDIKA